MNPMIKKLIRDYNYLSDTLEDIKEISNIAENEFRNALMETDPEALNALMPKTQELPLENVEVVEESFVEKHNDLKFKKLFRKIAIKCHPDKIKDVSEAEAKFLKKIYEDLNEANSNHDWGMLLKLAMEMDIEFDELSENELENISNNINELHQKIKRYENSMAFTWYIKNDENSKKEYLAICANIFKKSINNH